MLSTETFGVPILYELMGSCQIFHHGIINEGRTGASEPRMDHSHSLLLILSQLKQTRGAITEVTMKIVALYAKYLHH